MDLIGRVGYIENRLGERKPDLRRRKSASKPPHAGDEETPRDEGELHSEERETGIGRVIDVTA